MRTLRIGLGLLILAASSEFGLLQAATLRPDSIAAWEAYLRVDESRIASRRDSAIPFLWADEVSDRVPRLKSGAILVAPAVGNGTKSVPGGLVHHWLAAEFIPHTSLSDVLRIARDYANYRSYFRPDVVDSRLLSDDADTQRFSMRSLHHVLFVTAAMESEFETHDFPVSPTRWYIIADSTRVQEVGSYGQRDEHLVPPDRGRGFVWRLRTISRYEERDGGVYVEMETMALSRDIPAALRWLVVPAVSHFSQRELVTSLRQTREAVQMATEGPIESTALAVSH